MSYTTSIRSFLASTLAAVPNEVIAQLNAVDEIGNAAMDLILSADNEGCSEELTVVDGAKVADLSARLNAVSDDNAFLLTLALSCRDDDGMVVDTVTADVTLEQLNSIVDTASDLVLAHRKGQSIEQAIEQLDSDLVACDVLSPTPEVNKTGDLVELLLTIDTDDGLGDSFFSSAMILATEESVLVDFQKLINAPATKMIVSYPNGNKYGVPAVAFQNGAVAFVKQLQMMPVDLDLIATDTGDDSGDQIQIVVQLPPTAFVDHGLDDVREFCGLHWKKDFDYVSSDEKTDLVNRYVNAIHGQSL